MSLTDQHIPLLGVDTGGTFTDLVLVDNGRVRTWKLPSTPDDPSRAVLEGISHLAGEGPVHVFHGSTVATNALLEGKGAAVAFVVTAGFRDLLEIGRQNRPVLYALHPVKHRPLVPREKVVEVDERILADGSVSVGLREEEIQRVVTAIMQTECDSVALCLLHSYANPSHEFRIAAALRKAGKNVSVSHVVLSEFREFERASTTAVNAAVSPVMDRYLKRLEKGLVERPLRIMQSNGGSISADTAGREGVRTILSGPAGGLVGAFASATSAGYDKIITFDMGGTSTDVALCNGEMTTTTETVIAGWPLKVPMADIHTVGAGGGSLARIDVGGALTVGPESAGAVPGPVCYGLGGDEVTVTDANLALGRLLPDRFLGGRMALEVDESRRAIATLAQRAGLSPERLAEGVLEVSEETMAGALRVVSVQRGHDPREFTLMPFGGAGGLHVCALAEKLGIPRILFPVHPGLLSAVGMVLADIIRDYARSVLWSGDISRDDFAEGYRSIEEKAREEMTKEGVGDDLLRLERSLDIRYKGQSFEVTIRYDDDYIARFHRRHEELYGYQDLTRELEIVTLRLRAIGPGPEVDLKTHAVSNSASCVVETRSIFLDGQPVDCPVYERTCLSRGETFEGPALIVEETATHLVRAGWGVMVDGLGNLVLERQG